VELVERCGYGQMVAPPRIGIGETASRITFLMLKHVYIAEACGMITPVLALFHTCASTLQVCESEDVIHPVLFRYLILLI
jgi:hypothetical protein